MTEDDLLFFCMSICRELMIIFVLQHVVLTSDLYTATCCMQMHGKHLCISTGNGGNVLKINVLFSCFCLFFYYHGLKVV